MPVLKINSINVGTIIAVLEEPKGTRRDIGDNTQATDGSMRITRQTRKRDLKFKTIQLSLNDSYVWESFITGEGEVWSFDTTLYGSKGLGPSASVLATIVAGSTKFGAGMLNLAATTGSISYAAAINSFGTASLWSVSVYRSTNAGVAWTHYIVRSDGAKWVDGARNDAASTTWLSVSGAGTVTIANTTGGAVQYDDLIVFPFKVLDTWPAIIFARTTAYPPLPYLDLDGDFIPEQTTRRVLGSVDESTMRVASGSKSTLNIELKAK